jgi:hypothetical protein
MNFDIPTCYNNTSYMGYNSSQNSFRNDFTPLYKESSTHPTLVLSLSIIGNSEQMISGILNVLTFVVVLAISNF